MPRLHLSQLFTERPWRWRKQEKEQPQTQTQTAGFTAQHQQQQQHIDDSLTATIERNARRISRIWRNNDTTNQAPVRRHSTRPTQARRSFFRPNDEPILVEDDDDNDDDNTAPPLERETLLNRLKRRSQDFKLPRPRTSTGIPRSRNFFQEEDEERVPKVPSLYDFEQHTRPRHVPITIDQVEQPPPVTGMAITSNEVQSPSHAFVEKSRTGPVSASNNSFSHLRVRSGRTTLHNNPHPATESESSNDDILTALPGMDFKEVNIGEIRMPDTFTPVTTVDRQAIQRVKPKVVDIVAPRPLSMIASQPAKRDSALLKERHKSMVQTPTTPIGPLEDGPKGDWSRTRHSWVVGLGEGESEQLEWDKLKQFMEAYGNGEDGGIISVRPVDTDSSDSSGSARNSHGAKFSNAQALAALEFGLT